jgi:hypothetical protein
MSLLTMGSVGIARDLADAGESVAKQVVKSRAPVALGGSAAYTAEPGPTGGQPIQPSAGGATFGQLLVAQIPSEALLAYTTVLALFTAGGTSYKAGRWVVYAVAIVVCAATVVSSYFAKRDYDFDDSGRGGGAGSPAPADATRTKLHLPLLPSAAAMASMAVYGLTVPGSPLQFEISGTAFGIWSGSLAVAGGVLMMILAPFLGKGNGAVTVPMTPAQPVP